jgi:hypothetical protein
MKEKKQSYKRLSTTFFPPGITANMFQSHSGISMRYAIGGLMSTEQLRLRVITLHQG